MINIQEKKNKILEFLDKKGPSLPVQVAKAIEMEPVFASAILSELLGSKQIKTSQMKIGASPLYLIPGQEEKLEIKTEHLKSIEKETQEKLKSKKILTDEQEEPATRVALRNIRDFATPFKFKEKIMWKYSFTPQSEIDKMLFPEEKGEEKKENIKEKNASKEEDKPKEEDIAKEEEKKDLKIQEAQNENEEVPKAWEVKKEEIKEIKKESKKIENIFKEKSPSKKSFLKEIEHFLKSQETHISSLEEVDKKKVVTIVKNDNKESMLFAFNKARITEAELLKCYKEADKKNLPYQIITRSNLTKKLKDTIRAYQKLLRVDKLEN